MQPRPTEKRTSTSAEHFVFLQTIHNQIFLNPHPINYLKMSASFDKAVSVIQSLPKDGPIKPTQADQLTFYGLYKQATIGDVNTSRPGMLDLTGKAKWDAWKKNEGKSQEDAKSEYVKTLVEILKKHSDNEEAKKYIAEIESA
ncbi:unnamed protein product [Sympodiomycopsis kandeliae]